MDELIQTPVTINNKQEVLEIPRFTLLVHQQGIRVDVPDFVEINSRKTIDCMEKMNQKQWEHISTGQLFQILFRECFTEEIQIPKTIQELNAGDYGVTHVSGMIVLACEAIFEKKTKIFFRTPEDHLHPKVEQRIMGMFKRMLELLGYGGDVKKD